MCERERKAVSWLNFRTRLDGGGFWWLLVWREGGENIEPRRIHISKYMSLLARRVGILRERMRINAA